MAKVASIMTDWFEDCEYTDPKIALETEGHTVVTVGIEKGSVVIGKAENTKVTIEVGIDEADPSKFDALLIPGGYSPDKLRGDERVLDFVRHFAQYRKPIFTICHGPQLLVNADVIRGKDLTAVKQCAIDVTNAGANFYDAPVIIDPSGIISSRTPADLPEFNKAIVDALK